MSRTVAIVGAGMGGLAAAARLAQRGLRVRVFEASAGPGGLASGLELDGLPFDAGPYILLDRLGLEWAFEQLGLDLSRLVTLKRIEHVYRVSAQLNGEFEQPVEIHAEVNRTADNFERVWPGTGTRYRRFIQTTRRIHERLRPLLFATPSAAALLRSGAVINANFLLRSLGSVLRQTGLPEPIVKALGIWTHVAAQKLDEAPSPLALVPALIHSVGAFYPVEGIGAIPKHLEAAARAAGVEFHYGVKVRKIRCEDNCAVGLETSEGEFHPADAVLSNYNGVGSYLELLDAPKSVSARLRRLPLQSPGVCAYLAVNKASPDFYLRFVLPGAGSCRLLVSPSALAPEIGRDGWWPARLIAPMPYSVSERGLSAQREFLDGVLAEPWWCELVGEYRVLATRIPAQWGERHNLYRESMNPVMTGHFMRAGRIAHRSPWIKRLYLAGSSTHPGQWVSFCAISGILAADKIGEDLA
jgi:phytoene dehydrogenase-like protein